MDLRKETATAMANREEAVAMYPVGTKMEMPNGFTALVTVADGTKRTLTVEDQIIEVTVSWMTDSINIDGCKIVD